MPRPRYGAPIPLIGWTQESLSAGQLAQIENLLAGVGGGLPLPPLKAGQYLAHDTHHPVQNISIIQPNVNWIYGPILTVPRAIAVDQVAIDVTSAGAGGSTARVGLMTLDDSIPWRANKVQDLFTPAVDSTGLKTSAFSFTFQPDVVYVPTFQTDITVSVRSFTVSVGYFGGLGASDGAVRGVLWRDTTYAALPSTVDFEGVTAACPRVMFRVVGE